MATVLTKRRVDTMQFRDLKRQYDALKVQLDAAVADVFKAGVFIGGEPVRRLEEELAQYVGVRHAITCANGTDALSIALKIWGVGPGDAVFVPSFTFFASAETVAVEGALPVFTDVREDTFNMDPSDLERKIKAIIAEGKYRPRVIVTVDLFGQPADYTAILPLAKKYGLLVLEDGAQGFGGSISEGNGRKKMACSFGDISTTSFFPAKPLGCYGDGGAIFTDSDEWAEVARSLKVHGKGADKYDNVRLGMNSRLDTLQAAILSAKLKAFREYELDAVNGVADRYSGLLGGAVKVPAVPEGFRSSWAQYTIRLSNPDTRDKMRKCLEDAGIPANIYYPRGMHRQIAFQGLPQYGDCPVTDRLCETVLSLPIHPYMTEEEVAFVAENVLKRV